MTLQQTEHRKTRRRVSPRVRRQEILDAAIKVATRVGYQSITRDDVALEANVSTGLVTNYFSTMSHLKDAVIAVAIEQEIIPIVAQGLSVNDPQVKGISPELKQKVLAYYR